MENTDHKAKQKIAERLCAVTENIIETLHNVRSLSTSNITRTIDKQVEWVEFVRNTERCRNDQSSTQREWCMSAHAELKQLLAGVNSIEGHSRLAQELSVVCDIAITEAVVKELKETTGRLDQSSRQAASLSTKAITTVICQHIEWVEYVRSCRSGSCSNDTASAQNQLCERAQAELKQMLQGLGSVNNLVHVAIQLAKLL